MAPFKTYSKFNDTHGMKHSIYNSVAELTFKKRRRGRKKIVIPDLPPPSTVCQLSDNSLKVIKEDSFDRLLKTSNHNSIHFKSKSVASSDSSYEVDGCLSLKVKKPIIEIINYKHFPVPKKKDKTAEKTYNALNREVSAGTSIESSLEIEVVRKAKSLIDSSLGLTNSSMNFQKSINNGTTFEPVLCESFQNVPAICSTPIEPIKQKFLNQTISPITNNFPHSGKGVSNTHESSNAVTPIPKPKPDPIKKPVTVEISSGKTNRRISYITIRKRKIYFTPVALLTKRRFPKLSDNSSNSNNDPSNSEQYQKTSNENSRPHSIQGETTDLIEISLDNSLQHSKKKSIPIIAKIEPQIEMQADPVYLTLRNRKVSNNSSKKTRKALNFDNSDTFKGQNSETIDLIEISLDNSLQHSGNKSLEKSIPIIGKTEPQIEMQADPVYLTLRNRKVSNNSSKKTRKAVDFDTFEGQNSTQSIYKYVTENSKENKSSSIFSSESSCNGDNLSKTDFTNAKSKIEQIENSSTCYESTNLEGSHKHVQNNRFEEVSLSILSVNTTENNFWENTSSYVENALSTMECEKNSSSLIPINSSNIALNSDNTHEEIHDLDSIKCTSFKSDNIQQSIPVVYEESMCDSNIEENYEVNVRESKRNWENRKIVSQFEEPENVSANSRTSMLLPMEVIVNITRNSTDLENSLNNKIIQEPSTGLYASVIELEDSCTSSMSWNSNITPNLTPEIKGSNAPENVLIKNSFNLEKEESLITDSFKSLNLNNEIEEEQSSAVKVKENSEFINFIIKHQPIVNIKKSDTIEKLLNANPVVDNQISKRQSETSNFHEPFRGFDCNSIQQQSSKSTPSHCGISNTVPEDIQSSNNHTLENVEDFIFTWPHTPLKLKPGKSYRRSLLQIRNSTSHFSPANTSFKAPAFPFQERGACIASTGGICTCAMCKRQSLEHLSPKRVSVRFMLVSPSTTEKSSTLQNYAAGLCKGYNSDVFQESLLENYFENLSLTRENLEVTLEGPCREPTVTAREIVLRRCGQTEPLPFEKCYPNSLLQHCHKIGEGVYGEVFLFRNQNGIGTTVMKIIPIEGDQIINGEKQKKFDEIISEIIIAMELSSLRNGKKNNTTGFNELYKICCVQGKYPERLLELWELYDEGHGTENDSPEIFPKDQLYIILEIANGGKDLEAFVFNNAQQAYAIFIQTACAIAVAETALQFEHRDLHWGNILISNCHRSKKKVRCCIDGEEIELPTFGVEVAIIDFTLSRITHDGVCIYNDLSLDADLFTAKGDYQFDIYRLMKSSNGDQWQHFQPYTNVLWLHYTLDKMITAVRYKNKKTRMHKEYLIKLEFLKQEILEYKSVKDIVKSKFMMDFTL